MSIKRDMRIKRFFSKHAIRMDSKDIWKMFQKTGDIEWYSMYRSLKEEEEPDKTK